VPEPHRHLRIPADVERVAEIRGAVREVATACNAEPDCLDDLVQAVDEATTNVIVHGYAGAAGPIDVDVARVGETIVITVEDEAAPYDPTTHEEPDLSVPPEHRRPGGMGIHLMRAALDRIEHRPRPGGGNILTMTRRLERRSQGG
jgi:anti-sigma regulatory factor (Ser/Thr protein kinase)